VRASPRPLEQQFAAWNPALCCWFLRPTTTSSSPSSVDQDSDPLASPPTGIASARAAVILPDYCARVAVLDFDAFPDDPEEQQALVRFR
jgi:hypothetical protein